jgi:hypothetical protein
MFAAKPHAAGLTAAFQDCAGRLARWRHIESSPESLSGDTMRSSRSFNDVLRNPLVIVFGAVVILYFGYLFGQRVRDWVN